MEEKFIIFITGASGVGKTTLLNNLQEKHADKIKLEFLKFDSVGVPPSEEMVRDFGSGENWQRQTTCDWIDKMVNKFADKDLIVIDGQANLEFIKGGFDDQNFQSYQIVLIDCEQEIMVRRLIDERQQAWLASQDMNNWLNFLRNQAHNFKTPIIDTSYISQEAVVMKFEEILKHNQINI